MSDIVIAAICGVAATVVVGITLIALAGIRLARQFEAPAEPTAQRLEPKPTKPKEPPVPEIMPVSMVLYGKRNKLYVDRAGEPTVIGDGTYNWHELETGRKLTYEEGKGLHDELQSLLAMRHATLFDVRWNSQKHEFR